LRLAEEYLVRGDVKEALGIYQRISETEPLNLTIKSRLGEICALANQNSDAVRVLVDVARSHIREGHSAEAVPALKKVLALNLSDPDELMDLAGLCGRSGLSAEAERCYLQAADIYAGAGETAKLEAAYELAAAVAPADAEVLMKLGAACHRSGRMAEAYRAFMKAAAEFKRRGDDSASLDAYGKALKVAPTGAEAGNAVAEVMKHLGLGESPGPVGRARTAERPAPPLQFPHSVTTGEHAPMSRADSVRQAPKAEATDDELIVGKISKAELLFGFGRFDQAIALLKELVDLKPNDARVYRKLKDIYLRSEMPEEAAGVYRELARIYKAEGDDEMAADCAASARRLSGLAPETSPEFSPASAPPPSVVWQPVGKPKEPDLTLITPALPANPPAPSYSPTRQRSGSGEVKKESAPIIPPAPETTQDMSANVPRIVLSAPPTSSVRVSTPPLSTEPDEAPSAIEPQPGSGSFDNTPASRPFDEPGKVKGDAGSVDPLSNVRAGSGPFDSPRKAKSSSGPVDEPRKVRPDTPTAAHNVRPETSHPLSAAPVPVRPADTRVPTATKPVSNAAKAKATTTGKSAKPAKSSSTLFGVELDEVADTKVAAPAKRRYWIAAAVAIVVLSGSAAGYLLVRRNQARNKMAAAAQTMEPEPEATPTESPVTDAPLEVNVTPPDTTTERSGKNEEPSPTRKPPEQPPQRQNEYEKPVVASSTPYATPVVQQPKPTPPPMIGPVSPAPGSGSGPNVAPGALARDLPAAPPPPTPGPTVRRAAVMAGGEVVRRVEPVYPQAARAAHITGTVTVELGINEQGNVVSARATSGPGMLASAAESAARGFKFKPITLDGVPVKSSRTVLFHFKE
jgi:protein TonB